MRYLPLYRIAVTSAKANRLDSPVCIPNKNQRDRETYPHGIHFLNTSGHVRLKCVYAVTAWIQLNAERLIHVKPLLIQHISSNKHSHRPPPLRSSTGAMAVGHAQSDLAKAPKKGFPRVLDR